MKVSLYINSVLLSIVLGNNINQQTKNGKYI